MAGAATRALVCHLQEGVGVEQASRSARGGHDEQREQHAKPDRLAPGVGQLDQKTPARVGC
jgi:hypothetical protein